MAYRIEAAIASPRETLLPYITADENAKMAYPTNIMPGARDVSTPFGVMRVNEWGPANGKKVLFVHGDATPSPLWATMAHGLVQRGCRVMCYDLWGRGYSDMSAVDTLDGHHLTLQILFAISSSSVSWTDGAGFSLVGFSLGGAISTEFAGYFPNLVNSLVLLGPGGLLRDLPASYLSPYFLHKSWQQANTDDGLRTLVAEIMEVDENNPRRTQVNRNETPKNPASELPPVDESSWRPPRVDIAGLLQWQLDYNEGHVRGFFETTTRGPLAKQELSFRRACVVIAGKESRGTLLSNTSLLVFLGADDGVVKPDETREDISKFIPADKAEFVLLPGGHGFPYPNSEAIVERLAQHWALRPIDHPSL